MTTHVFQNGDLQAVELPRGYEFAASEISIRREGDAIILEPVKPDAWPTGFFEAIRIDDPAFARPDQGVTPPIPVI
jgi:virulence-associated protein VagC